MNDLISQLGHRTDLTEDDVEKAVGFLLDEKNDNELKAAFLQHLRAKGETAPELAAFVKALLRRAVDPQISPENSPGPLLDVCGTGGDRMNLFNVSTTSMFVLAAGGATVVKHGNRGITSKCGGADVLEQLGVRIDLPPNALRNCVESIGVGFLFAPSYHPAFQAIAPVRKTLAAQGILTIFNLLGPLLNPARPAHQLVGVFSETLLPKFAQAFVLLQRTHAWAVHGSASHEHGVDELSTMGPTQILKVNGSTIAEMSIKPEQFGLKRAAVEELLGGDAVQNARILLGILEGSIHGAKREVVVLNAAAGFVVAGLAPDLLAGILMATEQIDSGRAHAKLQAMQNFAA